MSRNGSGTYTVPNTFSPGQVISSADHNENFDDLGDEITNSLAVDGQSTMTGTLKLANGTVSLPGLTFGSDTDCGLARTAANELTLACGGVAKIIANATVVQISGGLQPSTSDGAALGSTSLMWSDLFLASGSVINFNNGDVTITHAANGLTFAGGSSGYVFDTSITASTGLVVSSGSVTLPAGSVAVAALDTGLFATQAQQETASSTTLAVSPGRQQNHPSAVKAWGLVACAGGTASLSTGYNVASITDNGTGDYTINLTTAFSSTNYATVATVFNAGGTSSVGLEVISQTASAIRIRVFTVDVSGANTVRAAADNISFSFMACGDQ